MSIVPGFLLRGGIHKVLVFYQGIMYYSSFLWESIHSLCYPYEYVPIVRFLLDIVFVKKSCFIMDICINIYSDLSIWLLMKKYFTSIHIYLYLTSEMALFIWTFMVVKSDVGVLSSTG